MRRLSRWAAAAFALSILTTGLARASPDARDDSETPGVELRRSRDAVLDAASRVRLARRELSVAQARFDVAQRALEAAERSDLTSRELGLPPERGRSSAVERYRRALRLLETSEGRLGRAEERLLVARRRLEVAASAYSHQ